ncbi:MAG: aldo/keto reductase, partial [Halioglobus sp.]
MLKPVQLGNSGLHVSQLCLGTMNFGVPGQGHQGSWTLDIDDSREIFRAAIDLGLFYFDCADFYGIGACEEVIGKLLRE